VNATQPPQVQGERRTRAIEAVGSLFRGFVERFGDTDCQTLTGCNWGREEDIARYKEEGTFKETCLHLVGYVLEACLDEAAAADPSDSSCCTP